MTLALACAAAAIGQTPEQSRMFTFAHISSPQQLQELANTIRSVGQVRNVSVDPARWTITAQGSRTQLALIEWLVTEIDSTPDGSPGSYRREFLSSADGDRWPAVRVFHPARVRTPLDLQEAVTTVRSLAETPMVAVVTTPPLIALRGSPEQAAAAEWIVRALDEEAPAAVREYRMPGVEDGIIRAFAVPPNTTREEYQAKVSRIRNELMIPRVTVCAGAHTIVLRGTEAQAQAAAKLLR